MGKRATVITGSSNFGLILKNWKDVKGAVICDVMPTSCLKGQVFTGDRIILINGINIEAVADVTNLPEASEYYIDIVHDDVRLFSSSRILRDISNGAEEVHRPPNTKKSKKASKPRRSNRGKPKKRNERSPAKDPLAPSPNRKKQKKGRSPRKSNRSPEARSPTKSSPRPRLPKPRQLGLVFENDDLVVPPDTATTLPKHHWKVGQKVYVKVKEKGWIYGEIADIIYDGEVFETKYRFALQVKVTINGDIVCPSMRHEEPAEIPNQMIRKFIASQNEFHESLPETEKTQYRVLKHNIKKRTVNTRKTIEDTKLSTMDRLLLDGNDGFSLKDQVLELMDSNDAAKVIATATGRDKSETTVPQALAYIMGQLAGCEMQQLSSPKDKKGTMVSILTVLLILFLTCCLLSFSHKRTSRWPNGRLDTRKIGRLVYFHSEPIPVA
jgi:hypothetical protein